MEPVHQDGSHPNQLRRATRITEIAANVVIICAVTLGGSVWLHRIATSSAHTTSSTFVSLAPLPGTQIILPDTSWNAQPSTLVVAISSACPHCVNNSSFYRDLTRSAHRIPILIVMPEQKPTAQSFLDEHGIKPSKMISADLGSIEVKVTPTLMLISSSGVVEQTWVGELDDKQRREVFTVLDRL